MLGAIPWPAHLKYYPSDHDSHIQRRRREVIDSIRHGATPVAVKKMSEDEGEMFLPEYWSFDTFEDAVVNTTAVRPFEAALKIHEPLPLYVSKRDNWTKGRRALANLQKRAFDCPQGTSACSSIGEDNYCCGTGQSCFAIQDTGLGPVGCCPSGVSCEGAITTCNTAAGQTACPQDLGGACCVAGFGCFDVGCVRVESVVETITRDVPTIAPPPSTSEVTTITSTATSTTVASEDSTSGVVVPSVTSAPSAIPTRDPNPPCNGFSSFTSCPPEIGGCCLSGRQCVAGNQCPLPGETITPLPPVRGTGTTVTTTTSPSAPESTDKGSCPTGFYACSAYYPGAGCCRIGRDCSSTYCPTTASQTVISNGREVVVPAVGAATSTADPQAPSSNCANGWSACPADEGAGCCPVGYECGVEWCSFVAPDARATESVRKEGQMGDATRTRSEWLGMVALAATLVLIW